MAKNTSNYNLKKPSSEDFYNVEDQNGNMDIIDQELKRLNEDNQNTDQKISSVNDDLSSHLSDYVRQPGYAISTGVANTYLATLNPAPTAYVDGMGIVVKINAANTGTATINVNGLGVKAIVDSKGNSLSSGKLRLNGTYSLKYNSTTGNFQLLGEGGEIPKLPNLVKNGSFENDFNCFAIVNATISTNHSFLGSKSVLLSNNNGSCTVLSDTIPAVTGDKIYVSCWVYLSSYTSGSFSAYIGLRNSLNTISAPEALVAANNTKIGQFQRLSGIYTIPSEFNNNGFRVGTYSYQSVSNANVDCVYATNLTQIFGVGNEPSKEEIDHMMDFYTNMVRSGNAEEGTNFWIPYDDSVLVSIIGGKIRVTVTTGNRGVGQIVNVKPNTDYYLSGNIYTGTSGGDIRIYTLDYTTAIKIGLGTFNSGSNTQVIVYLRAPTIGYVDFDSIMLIEGTTAPSAYKSHMPYGWWDSDLKLLTSDANAWSSDILNNKIAYVNGSRLVGSMINRTVENNNQLALDRYANGAGRLSLCPPGGYYDGSATSWVYQDDANFIPANIVSGKSIFGLTGTFSGKRWQFGTIVAAISQPFILTGLPFKPSKVFLEYKEPYKSGYGVVSSTADLGTGSGGLFYYFWGSGGLSSQINAMTNDGFYISSDFFNANTGNWYYRAYE